MHTDSCVTFQYPGLRLLYFPSGVVTYRYGAKVVEVKAGAFCCSMRPCCT
ncbi:MULTISPECIES: hypothetical protein [unclassified Variovorax]